MTDDMTDTDLAKREAMKKVAGIFQEAQNLEKSHRRFERQIEGTKVEMKRQQAVLQGPKTTVEENEQRWSLYDQLTAKKLKLETLRDNNDKERNLAFRSQFDQCCEIIETSEAFTNRFQKPSDGQRSIQGATRQIQSDLVIVPGASCSSSLSDPPPTSRNTTPEDTTEAVSASSQTLQPVSTFVTLRRLC